jgi:hypothetical protein
VLSQFSLMYLQNNHARVSGSHGHIANVGGQGVRSGGPRKRTKISFSKFANAFACNCVKNLRSNRGAGAGVVFIAQALTRDGLQEVYALRTSHYSHPQGEKQQRGHAGHHARMDAHEMLCVYNPKRPDFFAREFEQN